MCSHTRIRPHHHDELCRAPGGLSKLLKHAVNTPSASEFSPIPKVELIVYLLKCREKVTCIVTWLGVSPAFVFRPNNILQYIVGT